MREYNICYSLDSNYSEQLAVSITSILMNADASDTINFYILDGGLTDDDKQKIESLRNIKKFNIEYIKMNNSDFADCPLLVEKSDKYKDYHVTLPTYYRFKLAELFPKLDKILYIDCDIMARGSLFELFNTDLTDFAAAMVIDAESDKEIKRLNIDKYFNAGVMLINLDYWRKNDIQNKLFDYAKNNKKIILWQDQDIVNVVLEDKIKEIDKIWNFQYFQYDDIDSKTVPDCKIIHLAGRFKPWITSFEHVLYDIYYNYLSYTPWRNKEIQYKLNSTGKYLKDNIGGKNTNIVVMTTDKDLQKTYNDLNSAYSYVNTLEKTITANTDTKLEKVYGEIKKSYDFVKEKIEDSEFKTSTEADEKIQQVYDEIKKTYDFVKTSIEDSEYKTSTEQNEKINHVYDEIQKTYDFIKTSIEDSEFKTSVDANEKFSKVYDEIKKSYDFVKTSIEDAEFKTSSEINEKITEVYESIKKSYDFVKSCMNDIEYKLSTDVNDKIAKVYAEFEKSYEFIKNTVKDSEFKIEEDMNSKISDIYKEIEKSYEFVKNSINEAEFKNTTEINDKISKIYEEITNAYEFVKKCQKEAEYNSVTDADAKISQVYEEITKNYKYTEELTENVKQIIVEANDRLSHECYENTNKIQNLEEKYTSVEKLTNVQHSLFEQLLDTKLDAAVSKTEDKINSAIEEIDKNSKFTEYLVEVAEDKQAQNLENAVNKINSQINDIKNESEEHINNRANELYYYTDTQIQNVKNAIDEKVSELAHHVNKESDLKLNEVLAYTNEQTAKVYKEITEASTNIENTLNNKLGDIYRNNNIVNQELDTLKNNIQSKTDSAALEGAIDKIKYSIEEKDAEHNKNINDIKSEFEEKINQQRIKYEKKLIAMEKQLEHMNNKIKEIKRSPLDKFIDLLRNRPEKRQ